VTRALRRRRWPILATVVTLVAGMGYTLLHTLTVPGHLYRDTFWTVPSDLWGTYRSAHFIGWGAFGSVYSAGTSLVSFPGMLLLLTPVAMLTGALGLTESFPRALPHPTAWLVLGPYEILLSSVALFAADALAERLGVSPRRRVALCVVETIVLWNVDVVWGHPEDAVAVGLAIYALVLALDDRWSGAGWLFGAAVATQPLVLLMLPVVMALGGRSRVAGLLFRGAVPSALVLALPLAASFHTTVHAIVDQPNFPHIDHVTPWTTFAPVVGGSGHDLAVAGGPGRVVALVLALGLGVIATRWRHDPQRIVWAAGLALALRCFTESVMDPYYLWPVLAVGLVAAAATRAWPRLLVASVAAVAITIAGDYWLGGWVAWWTITTAGLVAVLLAGFSRPGGPEGSSSPVPVSDTTGETPVSLVASAP